MTWPEFISILLIATGLSADCFAVSLGGSCGLPKLRYVRILRAALAFGIAQAIMPTLGWLAGETILKYISGIDHWIAFGLLAVVGGKMILESFKKEKSEKEGEDITSGWLLVTLAIATSIDALAVGLSLAVMKLPVLQAVLIIGAVAFLVTHLGFYLGRKAGDVLGQRARLIGGLILIGIGLRILISHLLS
jgi:manganese efflux pump family protein